MPSLNDFEDFENNLNLLLTSSYKEAITNEELMKLLKEIKEKKLKRISDREIQLLIDFEEYYKEIATCISFLYS
jgi:hypothetical protein